MRLSKDLPNWVPMFGRKICLEYRGIRKQCNNCYGPHAKKFCRSERVGMENFVTGFRKKYPHVPESLYGKFAKPAVPSTPALQNSLSTQSASASGPTTIPTPTPTPAPTVAPKCLDVGESASVVVKGIPTPYPNVQSSVLSGVSRQICEKFITTKNNHVLILVSIATLGSHFGL